MVISLTVFEIQVRFYNSRERLVKAVERFPAPPSEIHSIMVSKEAHKVTLLDIKNDFWMQIQRDALI